MMSVDNPLEAAFMLQLVELGDKDLSMLCWAIWNGWKDGEESNRFNPQLRFVKR